MRGWELSSCGYGQNLLCSSSTARSIPFPRCCSEKGCREDWILTGHILLKCTFTDQVDELLQIDPDHVLNGVPVTAGQG